VLSSTSIFLSLKNEIKIFLSMETYEKGRPALTVTVYEHPTKIWLVATRASTGDLRGHSRNDERWVAEWVRVRTESIHPGAGSEQEVTVQGPFNKVTLVSNGQLVTHRRRKQQTFLARPRFSKSLWVGFATHCVRPFCWHAFCWHLISVHTSVAKKPSNSTP